MPDVLYRCGLPVAMGALAVGLTAVVVASAVFTVAAAEAVLGVGRAGRLARAHGVTVRFR